MKRVAILISGGGSNMVKLCESMHGDHPARPVLVASNDPEAGGLVAAKKLGISTAAVDHTQFETRADFEAELLKVVDAANPDIICLAGFMRILTPSFVAHFENRMLNVHPSLLPKYPGLNTHVRAIEAGDTEAGCTVHEVTPVLDQGPMFGQARVPVLPDDTADTLSARVLVQEHKLYSAVLRRVCDADRSFLALT